MFREFQRINFIISFCTRMSYLLRSGLPIIKAITIIQEDTQNKTAKSQMQSALSAIQSGQSFCQSLSMILPNESPFHQIQEVPDIPRFLMALKHYYESKRDSLKNLQKQLTYPIILLITTLFGSILFLVFVLPQYENFYQNMNIALPRFIQIMLQGYHFLNSHFWVTIGAVILSGIATIEFLKPKIKSFFLRLLYPKNHADFLWAIALLQQHGYPLKKAIESMAGISFDYFNFDAFRTDFLKTGHFAKNLATHIKLSNYHLELLISAEKSNTFIETLFFISEELKSNEDLRLQKQISILPSILLLCLGLMIFGFIYLIFLPIISATQNMI